MPTPQIVDRFNVDGQEYSIEPVIDPIPQQGSPRAVASGGVYADKRNVPVQGSTKNFTAGGAFDFFGNSKNAGSWLTKIFAPAVPFKNFIQIAPAESDAMLLNAVNGVFYACGVGSNAKLYYSLDLVNWTVMEYSIDPSAANWLEPESIIYDNGVWLDMTTGKYSVTGYDNFQSSGVHIPGKILQKAKWLLDRWFLVYDTHEVYYTQDLQTLTACADLTGIGNVSNIAAAHGEYYATVDGVGIYRSLDGVSFSSVSGNWGVNYNYSGLYCIDTDEYANLVIRSVSGHVWVTIGCNTSTHTGVIIAGLGSSMSDTLRVPGIGKSPSGTYSTAEFNGTILVGTRGASPYDEDLTGLWVIRPVRTTYVSGTLYNTNIEVENILPGGATLSDVKRIINADGVWIVYCGDAQPYPPQSGQRDFVNGAIWASFDTKVWYCIHKDYLESLCYTNGILTSATWRVSSIFDYVKALEGKSIVSRI